MPTPKSTDCGPAEVEIDEHWEGTAADKKAAGKAAHEEAKEQGQASCEGSCLGAAKKDGLLCKYFETSWKITSAKFDQANNKWIVDGVSKGRCQCE